MSHHYSGPDATFPHGDARLDLTDVYAFPSPGDDRKSILIMNVHPSSNLLSPGSTTHEPFAPDALYEFRIDTNGDAVADISYRITFSGTVENGQNATVRRADGGDVAEVSNRGTILIENGPVSRAREARVIEASDYRFFFGWRSDPFFFDPLGALDNFRFSGKDFFTDKDVCSIVLELPNSALGSNEVGIWARTLDGRSGNWIQADRGARPAQSIFLPGDDREAYLRGEPADDNRFISAFSHSLEHTGGYSPADAKRVAKTLLPDILRFAPSRPASYPSNGRALTDDVLDHFLAILTNGKVTTDGIGSHQDLCAEFPYLGPPHRDYTQFRQEITGCEHRR